MGTHRAEMLVSVKDSVSVSRYLILEEEKFTLPCRYFWKEILCISCLFLNGLYYFKLCLSLKCTNLNLYGTFEAKKNER